MLDELLELLIDLVQWPFEHWRKTTENSRVGTSPNEEKTLKFWKLFGAVGTVIISIIGAILYFKYGI